MKTTIYAGALALFAATFCGVGCSDDADSTNENTPGGGGSGAGGSAGNAGSAGKAGSAGLGQGGGSAGASGGGTGTYAACGENVVNATTQTVDPTAYAAVAADWSKEAISCRLGPTYEQLHNGSSTNDAPEVWARTGQTCSGGYLTAGIEVQEGPCDQGGSCYGSVAGQVLFVPTSGPSTSSPGMDRIQTHAWEGGAISSQPKRLNSPEPYLTKGAYTSQTMGQPIAIARSERRWTNDGIAIFSSGLVATAGTATSGSAGALYRFPSHLHPSAIAITTNNEFVLVTLWNTQDVKGQLAVFSVRGPTPNAHSWWYHGLYNVAGVRELKLLGMIDLPFATPTAISAVTNISWSSVHDAGMKLMSQVSFTGADATTGADRCYTSVDQMANPNVSATIGDFYDGGLHKLIARKGYAVVASQWENKVAFVDLNPLLEYYRNMYFQSEATCTETLSQFVWDESQPGDAVLEQAPSSVWPYTFDVAPASARPVVASVINVAAPRAVEAGQGKGTDVWKAWIASADGTMHVWTPGKLMASWSQMDGGTAPTADPAEIATFPICPHASAMVLHRGLGSDRALYLDVVPEKIDDKTQTPSEFGDGVIVVCRGTRTLQHAVEWINQGKVYEEIRDKRLNDPVGMWFSDRADVRTVSSFNEGKILSYRFGTVQIEDWHDTGCGDKVSYGPGADGTADLEYSGELTVEGFPFAVSVTNVN